MWGEKGWVDPDAPTVWYRAAQTHGAHADLSLRTWRRLYDQGLFAGMPTEAGSLGWSGFPILSATGEVTRVESVFAIVTSYQAGLYAAQVARAAHARRSRGAMLQASYKLP